MAMEKIIKGDKIQEIIEVLDAYEIPESFIGATRYGSGHINDTYCIVCQPKEGDTVRYILQGLSGAAFSRPDKLMDNYVNITSYLRKKIKEENGDPDRETLGLVRTKNRLNYYTDSNGKVWRLVPFIEGTDCYQTATPELFEASARAFGRFQYLLKDYPANLLYETIPHFHDTEDRFKKFTEAVKADKCGRAKNARAEIDFVLKRESDCSVVLQAHRDGKLPLRVTHNDTKLNNVLIDRKTGEGLCVIDLDTTMPGLMVNDFGDSIRFGANHSAEDEKDLSKVNFDIRLYESYTRGFLQGLRGGLTEVELEYMPWGARLMTLECGMRFLTDYLDGDNYFRTSYSEQNLDRCRTQLKLVSDMEAQFEQMCEITEACAVK